LSDPDAADRGEAGIGVVAVEVAAVEREGTELAVETAPGICRAARYGSAVTGLVLRSDKIGAD